MALRLVLGSSGSGKSTRMFEEVLHRAQKEQGRRFIFLVPEQNTLQTQMDLVGKSERGGILNIDVLSFTRLAFRVFEQTGVAQRSVLSETGKLLMLRLIASREEKELSLLGKILDRPGALEEVKSILSELDQYGIDSERLKEMERFVTSEGRHPLLGKKLSDIRLLQETFERYQADHYITGEKLPFVLCRKAPLDETLKGAVFYVDGFTGFTPAQLQVIGTLLKIAQDITVSVTIDPSRLLREGEASLTGDLRKTEVSLTGNPREGEASLTGNPREGEASLSGGLAQRAVSIPGILKERVEDHELFALSMRTIQTLIRTAYDAGVNVEDPVILTDGPGRHRKGSRLWWLEKHFQRAGKAGRMPYQGSGEEEDNEVLFCRCKDPVDEMTSAAAAIEELAGEGIRYREIAIVCGSLKDYAQYAKRILSMYEIPYYIDHSSAVVMDPAFEFVQSAITVLDQNFSYESVMALIRTGLCPEAESGPADRLENYLLATGIRGYKAWREPFSRMTKDKDQDLLDEANRYRELFMAGFEPFAEVMKKGQALFCEYSQALWKLFLSFDVHRTVARMSEECRQNGQEELAQEYASVMKVILDVLEEGCSLIGQETVTRSQFSQILRSGFSEAKIGILPRGIDEVQVGDLERTRLEHIKVVFFLGLNDSLVPRKKISGGVLTDMEREYLRQKNVYLAPTIREDAGIQQFYLYLALTKPSDRLCLSWSSQSRKGEELRPSHIVKSILGLFPEAKFSAPVSEERMAAVTSLRTGRNVLALSLSDYLSFNEETASKMAGPLKELLNLYRRADEPWRSLAQDLLLAAGGEEREVCLDEDTAGALYGEVLRGSITRLEEFSECAFRHFVRYGLRLQERERFQIESVDIGTLLHEAIERYSRKLKEEPQGVDWRTISDERSDRLADEAIAEVLDDRRTQMFFDTRRNRGLFERCRRILKRSVRTIHRQIRAGLFTPALFEVGFGDTQTDTVLIENLPGGRLMRLKGRIDRIDECDDPEEKKLYIKVVDYKSSAKKLDLDSLIGGEQLQLLVYMDAAAVMEQREHPDRQIVCAGVFYYTLQDPVIRQDPESSGQELEDAIVSQMKVSGLLNGSSEVVERLDMTLKGGERSIVIPAGINKSSGTLSASSSAAAPKQLELLRRYVRVRMREIARDILSGEIRPHPLRQSGGQNVCTWCPYKDVCRFDPHERSMCYREYEKHKDDELWEIIERTVSEKGSEEGS